MNTNSFNIQNVIRLTKNRIIESKRKLLLQALLYYGIILCIGFFWLSITNNDLPYIIMYTGFLIFFFAVNTASFFANILEDIQTKESNCVYFMIPASISEKFVSRLAFVIIKCIFLLGITFILAELTRSVLDYISGTPNINILTYFFQSNIAKTDISETTYMEVKSEPLVNAYNLIWSVWTITTFMLGGCWYRKRPFGKVILWHILLFMLIMIIGINQFFHFVQTNVAFTQDVTELTEEYTSQGQNIVSAIEILLTLLSVFNIWLSYRLFKRRQIIK